MSLTPLEVDLKPLILALNDPARGIGVLLLK